MLTRFSRADHPFTVEMIGKRNVDGIHLRVGKQLFIAAVSLLNAEFGGYAAALRESAAGHRPDHSGLGLLDRRHYRACGDLRTAHNSPAKLLCHSYHLPYLSVTHITAIPSTRILAALISTKFFTARMKVVPLCCS